jgi:hypothetical protein
MTRSRWLLLLVLGLAGVIAAFIVRGVLNRGSPLTAERLEEARQRWDGAGVNDYNAEISVSGNSPGSYFIEVRGGRAVAARLNGSPFPEIGQARYWTVPGLFDILENDLKRDALPGAPVAHTQATFDPADGHVVRYVRSVPGQTLRIDVRLVRP